MKLILQGTPGAHFLCQAKPNCPVSNSSNTDTDTSPDQVYHLINLVLSEHLLYLLATNIHKIPFEARKDTQFIFSNVLRYRAPGPGGEQDQPAEPLAVHYLVGQRPQVVIA